MYAPQSADLPRQPSGKALPPRVSFPKLVFPALWDSWLAEAVPSLREIPGPFSVGPGLSWSAFGLGRARARVRGSSSATDEARAAYQETILRALEETESSFASYHAEQSRLIKLNDQARESKRAAEIARLRYREGVIDFLSLLDAKRTQLQAEDAVAQSERDVYVAVIAMYKALGGVPG